MTNGIRFGDEVRAKVGHQRIRRYYDGATWQAHAAIGESDDLGTAVDSAPSLGELLNSATGATHDQGLDVSQLVQERVFA